MRTPFYDTDDIMPRRPETKVELTWQDVWSGRVARESEYVLHQAPTVDNTDQSIVHSCAPCAEIFKGYGC